MVNYYTFDDKSSKIEVATIGSYSDHFRSKTSRELKKYCFEFTKVSGSDSYVVGFAGSNNLESNVVIITYENLFMFCDTGNSFKKYSATIDRTKPVMACIDPSLNKFSLKHNNIQYTATTSTISAFKRLYLHVQEYNAPNPATVSINVGFKKFSNTLPAGYLPWCGKNMICESKKKRFLVLLKDIVKSGFCNILRK